MGFVLGRAMGFRLHRICSAARAPIVVALALVLAVSAGADAARVLRVGVSGDYAPFSLTDPQDRHHGLDVELARRFAREQGMELRFVRFRWPDLLKGLANDRFDVAWSGITVRPERSAAGRFSIPIVETGAVALVPEGTWSELDALDRPQIRIGVNAGGHLERVAAERFPRATRIAIPDNASVLEALRAGSVQAVVTDDAEAPHWIAEMPELVALGPFTADRKAALVHPEREDLARALDAWLLAREQDGSLAAVRREHLGEGPWKATAEPLAALLAAVDERLSLMPLVGFVKRESGVPLEVPEREAFVLDAASEAVLEAASRGERIAPPLPMVRDFFRAQLEAAKQVQRDAVADPTYQPPEPHPDLDAALRPALLRIGDRIAALIVALPPSDQASRVEPLAETLLREPRLAASSRREIAAAIARLLPAPDRKDPSGPTDPTDQARANARASSPAAIGSAMQTP